MLKLYIYIIEEVIILLKLLGDCVVIEFVEFEEKIVSGIVLLDFVKEKL